jgi:hypothetical protein
MGRNGLHDTGRAECLCERLVSEMRNWIWPTKNESRVSSGRYTSGTLVGKLLHDSEFANTHGELRSPVPALDF